MFINGRFLSQPVTGVQRYARELLAAVDRELGHWRTDAGSPSFHLLAPTNARQLPDFQHITAQRIGRLQGHAWEQLELPLYTRRGFLWSLANTGPVSKRRQIVTMHDASVFAVPDTYSPAFRAWYQLLLPTLGRVVDQVVTVSEFSRSELVRYTHIPEGKIRVIPSSGEHILQASPAHRILGELGVTARSYILAVGSRSPHKNLVAVREAAGHLPEGIELVVAGGENPRVFESTGAGSSPRSKFTGYISDGELRALYENAICLVYPSLYEGFGFPPLEAMACGCPVIASPAASLREVCGDAAMYCDPTDPASIADGVHQLLRCVGLGANLKERGSTRAAQLTWARSAEAMLALMREVVPG